MVEESYAERRARAQLDRETAQADEEVEKIRADAAKARVNAKTRELANQKAELENRQMEREIKQRRFNESPVGRGANLLFGAMKNLSSGMHAAGSSPPPRAIRRHAPAHNPYLFDQPKAVRVAPRTRTRYVLVEKTKGKRRPPARAHARPWWAL